MLPSTAEATGPSAGLVILIPVFNDWAALQKLLARLDDVLKGQGLEADILIVDDGSTILAGEAFPAQSFKVLGRVDVLRLRRNVGHQRAIAIGLTYVADKVPCQAVVLMDSDGEDDPPDVVRLREKCRQEEWQKVIFAERAQRSENLVFQALYALYKLLHFLLTGHTVRVGNFSIVPWCRLTSLAVTSELWNHYAAAVFKSRQPRDTIPTKRALRLVGKSQMNFVSLVIHGLSAMSVFGDVIGVRLLVLSSVLIVLTLVLLGTTLTVKLATDLAIPGWTTFTAGVLLIILLQAIMFAFIFSFIILSGRQALTFLPIRDYAYFIDRLETVHPKR